MVYTEFSREQILDDIGYLNICEYFFMLSTSDSMRKKLEGILYDGRYGNLKISTKLSNKDNPIIERKRRISTANLLVKNEEAFDELATNNINIFHGTNGNNLHSILMYGINSSLELMQKEVNIITKEEWSKKNIIHDYISFTDVLDVAEIYATLNNRGNNIKMNFPVIFGTAEEKINKENIYKVNSNIPEINLKKYLSVDSIKIVLVPFDKVKLVKKIVGDRIKVFGVDYYYDKFYSLSDDGNITILEDKFADYINTIKPSTSTSFENIEKIFSKKSLTNIKQKFEQAKILIKSEIDTYERERNK